jgi:hypothetical protein
MQRKPLRRSVRLIRPLDNDRVGVISITVESKTCMYTIREIPCFIGGRGFAVHRLGLGTLYHLRVGEPRDCMCECLGFLYRNNCRHVLGLKALIEKGKL